MIYRFIFDYVVCLFTPFNSCLMLFDIDESKIYEVFVIALVLDILFGKIILLLYLISLWLLIKKIRVNNCFFKNLLIFMLYVLFMLLIGEFSVSVFVSNFIFMLFYLLYLKHII